MTKNLAIYLDESGDLGFNFCNRGTPRFFIITLLLCHDYKTAESIKRAVKRTLKNKLQFKKCRPIELKGTETTIGVKHYFYRQIEKLHDWQIYSIILDKYKLSQSLSWLPQEHKLYNYLAKEILAKIDLSNVQKGLTLVVDKRKGKKGMNDFNKYLSSHLESMLPLNVSYDISHEQSHENYILQATDLFCWGIRRLFEYQDDAWFKIYKGKTVLVELKNYPKIKKDGP